MAVAIYFNPEGMDAEKYDAIRAALEEAGAGAPEARLHHSCFGPEDSLMVYDVWDSVEAFEEFGATLMPILEELGINPGEPDVMPVYDLIQ
jgi:hypothetical protein